MHLVAAKEGQRVISGAREYPQSGRPLASWCIAPEIGHEM
jgi:hypothetical protein